MRGPVSDEVVATLARLAGFEFAMERCSLLAPQLEWMLAEAARLEGLRLSSEEPVGVFRPADTITELADGQEGLR